MAPDNDHAHGTGDHHHPEIWPYRTDFLLSNASLDGMIDAVEVTSVDQIADRVTNNFDPIDLTLLTRHLDEFGNPTDEQELWLYDFGPGTDPMQAVDTARSNNAEASPIVAIVLSGHYCVMPATEPDLTATAFDVDTTSDPTRLPIAVVDSGFNDDDDTPGWLIDRVQRADSIAVNKVDDDTWAPTSGWRGHGKFVSSIIVQQNPQAYVTIAALKPVVQDAFHHWFEVDHDVDQDPRFYEVADEFALLNAVRRLLEVEQDYRALNLSLGAWAHDPNWMSGLGIWKALRLWQSRRPGAPIVAAAGNHHPNKPIPPGDVFIPGQWKNVFGVKDLYGVESHKKGGGKSEFSNHAPGPPSGRAVTGEAFLGVLDNNTFGQWSGTSFATAVVSAETVTSSPPTVPSDADLNQGFKVKLGQKPPTFPPAKG